LFQAYAELTPFLFGIFVFVNFAVVPKIAFARGNRILFGVFELSGALTHLFFSLPTPFFSRERRFASLAPVIFYRDKNQSSAAQQSQSQNYDKNPGETRHKTILTLSRKPHKKVKKGET
jgi:hypothetical protein